ncbi:MAG: glycosyltransferase, partial [Acidobacteriaceae bacterium]|nr:glycosyltransferase [Acidobacteriaceae bacterium]
MIHLAQYGGEFLLAIGLFGLLTSTIFLGMVCTGVVRLRREAVQQGAELRRRTERGEDFLPGVTLMKPLHGVEPGLAENLRSFYRQDYFGLLKKTSEARPQDSSVTFTGQPIDRAAAKTRVSEARPGAPASVAGVEFLFCARTEADAGLAVARQVAAEFPEIATRIVTSGEPWAPNAKVCSLVAMAKVAAHDIWVISDSDVRVTPDYLRRVVLPF